MSSVFEGNQVAMSKSSRKAAVFVLLSNPDTCRFMEMQVPVLHFVL